MSKRPFPTIQTPRLLLRELVDADLNVIYVNFSNAEMMRYYDLKPLSSRAQAEKLLVRFKHHFQRNRGVRWGIESRENGRLLGTIGYHTLKKAIRKAEIGYDLHPDHWGKGVMTEAVTAVLPYGFNIMQLNRIEARIVVDNTASARVVQKVGFTHEGTLRQVVQGRKPLGDLAIYALLAEEWRQNGEL